MSETRFEFVAGAWVVPNRDARLDIVFVHGLGGHFETSWSNASGEYWPFWLATDFPETNVYAVGYDSKKFKDLSAGPGATLGELATILLDLVASREGAGRRPVVFICHSLGGLIVKQMLRKSNGASSQRWKSLCLLCKGIVFIATPHYGTEFARAISNILSLLLSNSSQELSKGSEALIELAEWFSNWAPVSGVAVAAYHEVRPYRGIVVVDKMTANPNVLGCDVAAVDADHVTITKLESTSAQLYRSISSFLHELLVRHPTAGTGVGDLVLDPTPQTLPPGLNSHSPFMHRQAAVDRLAEYFSRWKTSGAVVGVTGPPDSGRTEVMRAFAGMIVEATPRDPAIAVLHVDCARAPRPLRAVYLSMMSDAPSVYPGGVERPMEDDDEDEVDGASEHDGQFIIERLRSLLKRHVLVTFFESFSEVTGNPKHVAELHTLFGAAPFKTGFQLLESEGEPAQSGLLSSAIPLVPFSAGEATDLLVRYGQDADVAAEAVSLLVSGFAELCHPGPLLRGAQRVDQALTDAPANAMDLALAVERRASALAKEVVGKLSGLEGCDRGGAMLSVMAIALFPGTDINAEVLDDAGLAAIPRHGMRRLGWLRHGTRLAGFGLQAAQAAAQLEFASQTPVAARLREAVPRLAMTLLERDIAPAAQLLDATTSWLARHAKAEVELGQQLTALHVVLSQSDAVTPLSREEEAEVVPAFEAAARGGDLQQGLASLAIRARTPFDGVAREKQKRAEFLESVGTVVELLAGSKHIREDQLTGFDTALYFGARRHLAFEEAARARGAVLAARIHQPPADGTDAGRLVWFGLLLNQVDVVLGLGRVDEAEQIAQQAQDWVAAIEAAPESASRSWALARLALLHERLSPNADAGRQALAEALRVGANCVALAPREARWRRFYLRIVRRLVSAERDETGRKRHVDVARAHLETVLGSANDWPLGARAQFAALMRHEARRSWKLAYQRDRAGEALALLWTSRRDGRREVETDARALLTQARLQAFLGEGDAAFASCEASLQIDPTPQAWQLRLRLLDGPEGGQVDWSGEPLREAVTTNLSPDLRQAIEAFRAWSMEQPVRSAALARVILWTVQRTWRAQGSLERHVSRELSKVGTDYSGLTKAEKLVHLRAAYTRRNKQVQDLSKSFARSMAIPIAEFRNTAQYIRCCSVVSAEPPDLAAGLAVLDKADKDWGGSHFLRYTRAEYLRYAWKTAEAIEAFRDVVAAATNGDLRRKAAASLARSLHVQAIHGRLPEAEREAQLREAFELADELIGSADHTQEMTILRDQLALELDSGFNSSSLDDAYEAIVGGIDGFPTRWLNDPEKVRLVHEGQPTSLAEVLSQNITDPEVLGVTGMLYLRRAELALSNDLPGDFVRAMAFFRAQALLERSWEGAERALTSFRIGQTILVAGKAFGSLNPIPGLVLDGRPDQMAMAEAKFAAAVGRTAGAFRDIAREHQALAARAWGLRE